MAPSNMRRTVTILFTLMHTVNSYLNNPVHLQRIQSGLLGKATLPNHPVPLQNRQSSFSITTNTNHLRYDITRAETPSSSSSALQVLIPGRTMTGMDRRGERILPTSVDNVLRATGLVLASFASSTLQSLRKYWWSFPMTLALVPPYSIIFKGTYASMPDWWGVVTLEHIATSENANWIISSFLGSNIAYAISGIYLMKRFRLFEKSQDGNFEFRPSSFSMLGVWISIAGLVSTIYHAVQALGPYVLAENLCYLDHAIAGSASFYFFNTCGIPSKVASTIGAVALVFLVVTSPGYAWFHSIWHTLSAGAATRWALDGYARIHQ